MYMPGAAKACKLYGKENATGSLEIGVSLKRRPLPGRRERVPCILYFLIVAHTVCFETIYPSAARTLATFAYDNRRSKYSCTIRCLLYADNTILCVFFCQH